MHFLICKTQWVIISKRYNLEALFYGTNMDYSYKRLSKQLSYTSYVSTYKGKMYSHQQ